MKTLTQTAQGAKETAIDGQRKRMIERYKQADETERQAIIKQIDSFIPALRSDDEKNFWSDFKESFEKSA